MIHIFNVYKYSYKNRQKTCFCRNVFLFFKSLSKNSMMPGRILKEDAKRETHPCHAKSRCPRRSHVLSLKQYSRREFEIPSTANLVASLKYSFTLGQWEDGFILYCASTIHCMNKTWQCMSITFYLHLLFLFRNRSTANCLRI